MLLVIISVLNPFAEACQNRLPILYYSSSLYFHGTLAQQGVFYTSQGCCSPQMGDCGCYNGRTLCCDGQLSTVCICRFETVVQNSQKLTDEIK